MAFVACVIVRDHKGLKRIGADCVVCRLLAQAAEVRGVGRVLVATVPELGNRVRNAVSEDVEVVEIPDDMTSRPAQWLGAADGPASGATVILCVYTAAPFLSTARMEACVDLVRIGKAEAVRTVQKATLANNAGPDADRPVSVVVKGAIAYKGNLDKWPRTFDEVAVSCVEALDVSTPEGERMAEALAFVHT